VREFAQQHINFSLIFLYSIDRKTYTHEENIEFLFGASWRRGLEFDRILHISRGVLYSYCFHSLDFCSLDFCSPRDAKYIMIYLLIAWLSFVLVVVSIQFLFICFNKMSKHTNILLSFVLQLVTSVFAHAPFLDGYLAILSFRRAHCINVTTPESAIRGARTRGGWWHGGYRKTGTVL